MDLVPISTMYTLNKAPANAQPFIAFASTLAFHRLLIGFYSRTTYSVSEVCCGQIVGLMVRLTTRKHAATSSSSLETCAFTEAWLHAGHVQYQKDGYHSGLQPIILFFKYLKKHRTDTGSLTNFTLESHRIHLPRDVDSCAVTDWLHVLPGAQRNLRSLHAGERP